MINKTSLNIIGAETVIMHCKVIYDIILDKKLI